MVLVLVVRMVLVLADHMEMAVRKEMELVVHRKAADIPAAMNEKTYMTI